MRKKRVLLLFFQSALLHRPKKSFYCNFVAFLHTFSVYLQNETYKQLFRRLDRHF